MRSLGIVFAAIAVGCGSPPNGDSSGGSSGSSGTGGTGGGGTFSLPPVRAACASPVITQLGSLPLKGGSTPPAAAWGGEEAAVVFYDGTDVKLQQFTEHGDLLGSSIIV